MEEQWQAEPAPDAPAYVQRRRYSLHANSGSKSLQNSPHRNTTYGREPMADMGATHSGGRVRRELSRELSSAGSGREYSGPSSSSSSSSRASFVTGGGQLRYFEARPRQQHDQPSSSGRETGPTHTRRRASIAVPPGATSTSASAHLPRTAQRLSSSSGFPKPMSSSPRESGGNIRVVVRIRPLSEDESKRDEQLAVHPSTDPSQPVVEIVTQGPRGSVLSRRFNFHCVAGPEDDEVKLLKHMGLSPLLDSALAGYGATIMCYGQTGSGKTHTLFGKGEEAAAKNAGPDEATDGLGRLRTGLVAQSLHYIYATMQKYPGIKYATRVSCLEIHNENIYDLLDDGLLLAIERGMRPKQQPLPVRWDASRGFHVQNLRSIECEDVSSALHVMWRALLARRVGAHELNRESSRSHCMMTLHLEARGIVGGATCTRYGKVAFVDLAGSERLKASKSSGDTLKETTNINKSLLTLGKVVSALSETNNSGGGGSTGGGDPRGGFIEKHIPYRDSKLTKLLMDSLGGSCLSCIVACCSPGASAVDETLSTLNYATRAKHIVNKPLPHMDPHEGQIAALKGEIRLLRRENRLLRTHLGIGEHVRITAGGGDGAMDGLRPSGGGTRDDDVGEEIQEVGEDGDEADVDHARSSNDMIQLRLGSLDPSGLPQAEAMTSPRISSTSDGMGGGVGNAVGPMERNRSAPLPPFPSPLMQRECVRGNSAMDAYMMPADFREENFFAIPKAELVRRLKDAQNLINEFSAQNERIAHENERLRGSRQMLELDYKCLVSDNEKLQASLSNLEDVFINNDDGTAEAFGKMSLSSRGSSVHASSHSHKASGDTFFD